MASKIQLRRGLKSDLPTLSSGEPAYTTDTRELYVGTGSGNVNMGGSHWYMGTAMSGTTTTADYYSYSECPEVKIDDMYLNTTYGYIYACTTAGSGATAKWTYKCTVKGSSGTGDSGTDSQAIYSATPTKVGEWIDGNSIYRIAWQFTVANYKNIGVAYSFFELPNCPSVSSGTAKGTVREFYCHSPYGNATETQCFSSVSTLHSYLVDRSSSATIIYCVVEYIAA